MMDRLNRPLTILHIFSGDLWAGAEVMIFHLLNCLNKSGEFEIIALSLNEGELSNALKKSGINTYIVPEGAHSFFRILWRADGLLKGNQIDIIHSHRYKENLLAFLLAQMKGVKHLVTTIHGISGPLLKKERENPLRRLKTAIDYFVLNHFFTRMIAVSYEMRKNLIDRYDFRASKLTVIHNGIVIQPDNFSGSDSVDKTFHIGSVGRLAWEKDFDLFLEIAAEIIKVKRNVRFSILGDGPLKENLAQKAVELGIADQIEFLAARANPFAYYHSLDLYLNTSRHEGIPLSILEAMACGKTVVAASVGGIPEIISHFDNGVLVSERAKEQFVPLCLRLMVDENLRKQIGKNAAKTVASRFSDGIMASAYSELYQQIILGVEVKMTREFASGYPKR